MIELISYGRNNGPPPEADMHILCSVLPDPSPFVSDLPGTDPEVGAVIREMNPLAESWFHLVASLVWERVKTGAALRVAFECAAGWHRSVSTAEYVADVLDYGGIPVTIIHRDLEGFR